MGHKISKEVLFNRQVNYILIEKMWEYHYKGIDKQEMYDLLDINKNTYTRIRTADDYSYVDLEKKWEKEKSALKRLGLSKEIMIGLQVIETEDITLEDWKTYLDYRYINTEPSGKRINKMSDFNKRLKKMFDNLRVDKKTTKDIEKLHYFMVHGRAVKLDIPDAEMIDLRDSLKNVTIEKIKVCDKDLRKEIYEALKRKCKQINTIINYEDLKD